MLTISGSLSLPLRQFDLYLEAQPTLVNKNNAYKFVTIQYVGLLGTELMRLDSSELIVLFLGDPLHNFLSLRRLNFSLKLC